MPDEPRPNLLALPPAQSPAVQPIDLNQREDDIPGAELERWRQALGCPTLTAAELAEALNTFVAGLDPDP